MQIAVTEVDVVASATSGSVGGIPPKTNCVKKQLRDGEITEVEFSRAPLVLYKLFPGVVFVCVVRVPVLRNFVSRPATPRKGEHAWMKKKRLLGCMCAYKRCDIVVDTFKKVLYSMDPVTFFFFNKLVLKKVFQLESL